jgi:AraC family transcriptional regulator of adaptative response/methylated-DNA-[protein]-cysteine methyltransferase
MNANIHNSDYDRIAEAIRFLEAHALDQPDLDTLADYLGLSSYHLQRLFTRWAGISPKRFVQYLTVEYAKETLRASHNVLDASLESGLSGPGRLHDLFVTVEAVTPGEFKTGGLGLSIAYGVHESPFGACLLAVTERGVCGLSFVDEGIDGALADLRVRWPAARISEGAHQTGPVFEQIFPNGKQELRQPVALLLKGTNFQIKVWEALLQVPSGAVCTYEDVAQSIGQPTAARAVGSAVSANAIAYLIPCHRVIRKTGLIRDYRWGATRKKAILGWEAARHDGYQERALM